MSRSTSSDRGGEAGFTLIEVLVALAVVTVSLVAIGSLIATTIRGMRAIDSRLALIETARAVETALPDRDQMIPGNLSGEMGDHRWRIDVTPLVIGDVAAQRVNPWLPQTVTIQVRSPGGSILQLDTVRLRRRPER